MSKWILLFALVFCVGTPMFAQIQVPVAYNLGVKGGECLPGFITGGTICEPEGLSLLLENATVPVLINYTDLDEIASLSLNDDSTLSMEVTLKDGKKFPATTKITASDPIIILVDEVASGSTATTGKERSFTQATFKGIPLIEFEAGLPIEDDFDQIKEVTQKFQQAIDEKNLDQAVDLYNQIGELLDGAQARANEGENGTSSAPIEEKAPEN